VKAKYVSTAIHHRVSINWTLTAAITSARTSTE
jgi:hypothetical protein